MMFGGAMNSDEFHDPKDLVRRRAEIISEQQEKLRRAIGDLKKIAPDLTSEQQLRAERILRMMVSALDMDDELASIDQ